MTISGNRQYKLMGIVNLTGNSFFSPSRLGGKTVDDVIEKVDVMIQNGADIIDIGACSSAPGNSFISEEEEWARLSPVLPALFSAFPETVFSLDSFRSSIIAKAVDLGRKVIANDIFACNMDSEMLEVVKSNGLDYVAMDSTSNPFGFFCRFAEYADGNGLDNWILDPGFGFGKTVERNWEILENLQELKCFGKEIMVALSHKRMVYVKYGLTPESCSVESVAAEKYSVALGASIIRTHDLSAHQ